MPDKQRKTERPAQGKRFGYFKGIVFSGLAVLLALLALEMIGLGLLLGGDVIHGRWAKVGRELADFPRWTKLARTKTSPRPEAPPIIEKLRGDLVAEKGDYFIIDPWLAVRMRPLQTSGYQKTGKLKTDRFGFIYRTSPDEFKPEKSQGVCRIFLVGGSTATGVGAESNQTALAAVAAAELSKSWSGSKAEKWPNGVELINAACYSYYSPQELVSVALELLAYDPDLIVVFNGRNDARMALTYDEADSKTPYHNLKFHQDVRRRLLLQETGRGYELIHGLEERFSLISGTYLGGFFLKRLEAGFWDRQEVYLKAQPISFQPPAGKTGVDFYLMNLRSLAGASRANGAKCLLLLQPTLGVGDKPLTPDEEKLTAVYTEKRWAYFRGFFARARAGLTRIGADLGPDAAFEDMTGLFDKTKDQIYIDTAHYNQLGNDMIARAMARRISRLLEN